jgi:hypothetical protein
MDINEVQQALNELGANPQLAVDGVNSPVTQAAVSAFQKANGLTADGIVGPATGAAIAAKLRAAGKSMRGIPIELALVLDCTDWDMPSGGWQMPGTVGTYRFFYQSLPPGGGYGKEPADNQQLNCAHIEVPYQPAVLAWLKAQAERIVQAAPAGTKFYALLIRGLTLGDNSLSPLEYEQNILTPLGIACDIVSEGLFAHDSQAANQALLTAKFNAGYRVMLIGHSMGGDEVCAIAIALSTAAVGV